MTTQPVFTVLSSDTNTIVTQLVTDKATLKYLCNKEKPLQSGLSQYTRHDSGYSRKWPKQVPRDLQADYWLLAAYTKRIYPHVGRAYTGQSSYKPVENPYKRKRGIQYTREALCRAKIAGIQRFIADTSHPASLRAEAEADLAYWQKELANHVQNGN